MAPISNPISLLRQEIRRRQDKGVGLGSGVSCSLASATTDKTSTSTPVLVAPSGSVKTLPTSMTTAELPPELSALSESQPPNPPSPPSSSIRPSAELTVSGTPSTNDGADLWEQSYEIFRKQEPDLIEDYNKHLLGNVAAGADLSSRQSVETVLKKLLEHREKKQWQVHFLSHDIKIRTQVEGLAKFFKWSDPFVKDAVSTQPYAALAWSGVSLLLPASSR
jgi:N-terminal domain of NWD NACHT-NTPase